MYGFLHILCMKSMELVNNLGKILTHKGYSIRKDALTPIQTAALQSDLLVCPIMNTKFSSPQMKLESSFKLYRESATRWYLPRHYGVEKFGKEDSSVLSGGTPLPASLAFVGTPYPYQTEIVDNFVKAGANGLICVPCGRGKTFMAVCIAAKLGLRFLVIVDKEFLMNQWKGELQSLMPGIRIGILQGPKQEIDPEKYDCTICMIQTLCGREMSESTFQTYGFAIFDECHHLGAQHFSKTLQKVQMKYMLGLSATPKREDGLTKVFFWFLGQPVYWEKTREPDPTVIVKSVLIKTDDPTYLSIPTDWRGEVVTARLLTHVLGCAERTNEIVRWIRLLAEDEGRRILVLSERIGHLETIERLLAGSGLSIAYYIGGMKEAVREAGAASARILLASYAMASEAMNIKTLNTVVLASPRKHVEQSTGRILRVRPSERTVVPLIVDIVDSHNMYRSQWKKRLTYYKQCTYGMETWNMGALKAEPVVKKGKPVELDVNECLLD
jgi:superfamily II DNA or RNA helicase